MDPCFPAHPKPTPRPPSVMGRWYWSDVLFSKLQYQSTSGNEGWLDCSPLVPFRTIGKICKRFQEPYPLFGKDAPQHLVNSCIQMHHGLASNMSCTCGIQTCNALFWQRCCNPYGLPSFVFRCQPCNPWSTCGLAFWSSGLLHGFLGSFSNLFFTGRSTTALRSLFGNGARKTLIWGSAMSFLISASNGGCRQLCQPSLASETQQPTGRKVPGQP